MNLARTKRVGYGYRLRVRMPSGEFEWSAGEGFTTPDQARAAVFDDEGLLHEMMLIRLAQKNMPEGSLETSIELWWSDPPNPYAEVP